VSNPRCVVDSSGWIEVFTDGPAANHFFEVLSREEQLIVPSLSVLEVYKWILREHSESDAIRAAAVMQRGTVINLDTTLAMAAAQLSHQHKLPMADSVILATARAAEATLFTLDADFEGLENVQLISRL